jgi:type III secretory pathway component EscS
MNFDRFLAILFNKITVSIVALVATVIGAFAGTVSTASTVQDSELNEINCTIVDVFACVMCGCVSPTTGCALMENCQILACDCAENSKQTCTDNCNEMVKDCTSSMCGD